MFLQDLRAGVHVVCYVEKQTMKQGALQSDGEAERIFVRVGANVTLRCPDLPPGGGAQPPRHLTWWKEDRRLIEATRERVTVAPEAGPRVALVPGSSALIFRSVVAEDSGEYQCVVNNRQGRRGIVRLYVQGLRPHQEVLQDQFQTMKSSRTRFEPERPPGLGPNHN
ncbi:hypothetical protein V5799_024799 [Amblyomma americanum]|uniref:Ig-like domain-containing protein n=1 Tax=Amblyomma americanum TaxID=6943 RepID=A0AAQ4EB18_AMBAM